MVIERPSTLGVGWGLFLPFLFGKQIRGSFCPALGSPSTPSRPAPPPANATD